MKLPINPLLYLVSLASLGGIAHAVYRYSDKSNDYNAKARARIKDEDENLKAKGIKNNMSTERWNYRATEYWLQLASANFTGKVEKKPVIEKTDAKSEAKAKPEIIQIKDILEVICIARAGDETGVILKYTGEVKVPEGEAVTVATPMRRDTIPKGRRRGRITAPRPAPVQNIGSPPPDHVKIGEALWEPYSFVFLKSVAADASFATFELRIEDKKDKDKGYPTQDIQKGLLHLPPEVLAKLHGAGGRAAAKTDSAGNPVGARAPESTWVDTPKTTIGRKGDVNVARRDQEFLEKNGRDLFTDDVHMRDYAGGSGRHRIRGVQFRKLSGRVRQFGINEGDVLISINGKPVTGMASAQKVGRRLYKKGVRNFRAEILRQGRMITRTYAFKK